MRILEYPVVDVLPLNCYQCIFFDNVVGLADDQCMLLKKRMFYDNIYLRRYEKCPLRLNKV